MFWLVTRVCVSVCVRVCIECNGVIWSLLAKLEIEATEKLQSGLSNVSKGSNVSRTKTPRQTWSVNSKSYAVCILDLIFYYCYHYYY